MAHAEKVFIVGIGEDGLSTLSSSARRQVENAELLFGSQRTLDLIPKSAAERIVVGANLGEMVQRVEQALGRKRIVVLASGDPLFYGFARYLCDRLGKQNFVVEPHVSSMQLAFARIMESWDDAYLTNVGQRPLDTVIDKIRVSERVGLFTTDELTPPVIARALLNEGIDYFQGYVCENLGARDEVVTQGSLAELAEMTFGPLNVMILIRKPNVPDKAIRGFTPRLFGNDDEWFRQSRPKRGLLTPAEIRTLALGQLSLRADSVVWDIGAGSGAVSIESALLARVGRVFAIEPDIEDCQLIRDNAGTFGVTNVEVVMGRAPEALGPLPAPDAVFVGGVGRETVGILGHVFDRLKPGGRLVANVASLENVSAATSTLKPLVDHVGLLMCNLSRGAHQLDSIRFEAMNPSFLVFGAKPT